MCSRKFIPMPIRAMAKLLNSYHRCDGRLTEVLFFVDTNAFAIVLAHQAAFIVRNIEGDRAGELLHKLLHCFCSRFRPGSWLE